MMENEPLEAEVMVVWLLLLLLHAKAPTISPTVRLIQVMSGEPTGGVTTSSSSSSLSEGALGDLLLDNKHAVRRGWGWGWGGGTPATSHSSGEYSGGRRAELLSPLRRCWEERECVILFLLLLGLNHAEAARTEREETVLLHHGEVTGRWR